MVNVAMPGSAAIVLTELAKILRLSFIPIGDFFIDNANVGKSNQPLNTLLGQSGYQSTSILINLGPFMLIFFILFIALIISKCWDVSKISENDTLPMINGRSEMQIFTMMQRISNMIFRFMQAAMLELIICMMINIMAEVDSPTDFESISRIVSLLVGVIILLYLGLMFILAVLDSSNERDPDSLPPAAMQTLYLGMNNRRRDAANALLIASVLRSAVYALNVLQLNEIPGFQVQLLIIGSWVICAIITRADPYTRTVSKVTLLIYEHIFVWCCAFTLMFTPEYIQRSLQIAKDMGFVICSLSCITSAIGLILILHSLCWQHRYYRGVKERAQERAEVSRMMLADLSLKQL